jgi:hypothetical protein
MARTRLPLDLYAEITTADGSRYRWDANQAPGSRLRNFSFRTKIGEGFSDASGQLARRIDLDYPDLGLVNTITVVGADGSVAYEGRLEAQPRDLSDTHSIGVTLAGWMAHAKDRRFTEIYVDRRTSEWKPPSRGRSVVLITANAPPLTSVSALTDAASQLPSLRLEVQGAWASPYIPACEAWYDAGPDNTVASAYYDFSGDSNTSFNLVGFSADTDDATDETSGDIYSASTGSGTYTPATARRYVGWSWQYSATGAGTDGATFYVDIRRPAVFGNHGLTKRGTAPDQGFYASDVMRDIVSRWCPQLDTSGIQDTSYVVEQLAFTDRTFPYDALLELNKYHLWHLGVWENKRLDFRPYDLTDYDWEIRTDDPGTTFSPQGPSTDSLYNGITVQYQDILTGTTNVLTPDTNPELADTSSTNPWNQHGIDHWDEITLSTPSTEASAGQIGAAALADRNTPKTPGTITVRGYIRDRAGNDQPAWKPRAGQTIAITNFPNDSPRLIVETDYNDEDKSLRIAVDRPFQLLDAYLDRVGTALGARGLA